MKSSSLQAMKTEAQWEAISAFSCPSQGEYQVTAAFCGFLSLLMRFCCEVLGPAQNCMRLCGKEEKDPAVKQCVEQVNRSTAGYTVAYKAAKGLFLPQWKVCLVPWVCFLPPVLVPSSYVHNQRLASPPTPIKLS